MLIPLITRFGTYDIDWGSKYQGEFPTLIREIQSVDINVESINYDLTELVAGWQEMVVKKLMTFFNSVLIS